MDASEQVQHRLKVILEQIGPGISLKVDDRTLKAAFGYETTVDEASKFAQRHHCAFRYEPGLAYGDGIGEFGRAYFA